MPILPLPQFEADIEADRKAYEILKPPKTIVVRFGALKMVGEFPYDGDAKPGCGSKLVVRTHRGTELGEMLTSTCPNAGCSKSVSRKEMLDYIQNSGGRDYPFTTDGRVLRVATLEDLDKQSRLEQSRHGLKVEAKRIAEELKITVKIVDAEPILGEERITFYYHSEERVDFRDLVPRLSQQLKARIDLRQVGARDEARITADYERCGQHCCCKTFLKVLKPISMRSAKIQKATLDPLKISGRCGRLMCCLRYEDQTYDELRKRLPKRKVRVGTPEGDGWVVDTQILTQLVLVQLEAEDRQVAIPVENLTAPTGAPPAPMRQGGPGAPPPVGPAKGGRAGERPRAGIGGGERRGPQQPSDRRDQRGPAREERPAAGPNRGSDRPPPQARPAVSSPDAEDDMDDDTSPGGEASLGSESQVAGGPVQGGEGGAGPRKRRRRRRRTRRPPGHPGGGGPDGGGGGATGGGGPQGPTPPNTG